MTIFYTYLHCKPDGTPFYVGKGYGNRCSKFKCRNLHHKNIVSKYGVNNIEIYVFNRDSEKHALDTEIKWIKQLRMDGYVLVNQTDGGDGSTGYKASDETKAKLSAIHKGNKYLLGRKRSKEAKEKTSLSLKKAWAKNPWPKKPLGARACKKCGIVFDRKECPQCQKMRNIAYRAKNKAILAEKDKVRYEANRARDKIRAAKYYIANREKIIAKSKIWAEANPEKTRESSKKYQAKKLLSVSIGDK